MSKLENCGNNGNFFGLLSVHYGPSVNSFYSGNVGVLTVPR